MVYVGNLIGRVNRSFRSILVAAVGLIAALATAQRHPGVQVFVGTNPVEFSPAQPLRRGSQVMIPLREVAERLGWTVAMSPLGRSVTLAQAGTRVTLPLTGGRATRNGIPLRTRFYPLVASGRVLVPLGFFSKGLKVTTAYNARRGVVQIFPRGGQKSAQPATKGGPSAGGPVSSPARG